MFNYDPLATIDDDCIPFIYGCIDSTAFNYVTPSGNQVDANTDNGTCIETIVGCMSPLAVNIT